MSRTTPIPALSLFFVLQVATLSVHIMYGTKMVTDGLPMQERGSTDFEDILAGNDFLSVLLETTRLKKDTQSVTEESLDDVVTTTEPSVRETREANYYNELPTEGQMVDSDHSSDSSSSDGVIIAVHVSASVDSRINKVQSASSNIDQNYLASEDHPNIVANNGKSELTVDEPTPVTENEESTSSEPLELNRLQVQNLPSSQSIVFNGYPSADKDNVPPFHHSLIYHVDPNQPGARSVSYSTVIQDIPTKEKPHERKERNYETGTIFSNSFDKDDKSTTTTNVISSTTQKSWSPSLPKVYGKPEQNYEIDESVSVVTNGRTHGVQTSAKSKSDQDKDQKVGYVVEGRNYRKYRVEERTPDGFIVGEYGVVSHDDGSLRGVRYTADGTINPRLIYDALMKFLSL